MTRNGRLVTAVGIALALIVGFGAGWLTHGTVSGPPEPAAGQAPQGNHPDDVEDRPETGFETVTVDLDETHDLGDGFSVRLTRFERGVEEGGVDPTTGREGDLPYVSWRVELDNESDETVQTGVVTRSCAVGDPLRESGSPALGDSAHPPESLEPGQSGYWDEDCWVEEGDTRIQYTIEFQDQDFMPIYPAVTFAGTLD
ncbi:hypothetical protein ACFV4I_15350 [Nocardiopsis alba]|jgi:hypothetical protein|uniref:DUF4352 domain-containing protein n=2 Tax=Nocardiopsis alba TaxID=53437 RepID=A0A7K2IXS3_9ACTN|nr:MULTISPECIES: hypothetical protein [Nocardiopsis]AFR09356.1 hypothetical protein B005_4162 [Nocardiopsis alba ATCC BAA-2165]MEC3891856.1 hypothetical protein [Nocardiopsis sp. LDBS1602]MYR34788.1 hypothetical protein [Nocardiopsis alba]